MTEMSVENVLFYEDWLRLRERTLTSTQAALTVPSNTSTNPTTVSQPSSSTTSPAIQRAATWRAQRAPPPRAGSYTHAFQTMLHMYILPNSQLELNLLASTRAEIIQKMEAVSLGDYHAVDVHLYDKVAEEVRQLMMTDTFPRYLKWRQQQHLQHRRSKRRRSTLA
jgi:hypothetical protein